MAKKDSVACCTGKGFPMAGLLLIVSVLWLLQAVNVLSWNLPWQPIVWILVALGVMSHAGMNKK